MAVEATDTTAAGLVRKPRNFYSLDEFRECRFERFLADGHAEKLGLRPRPRVGIRDLRLIDVGSGLEDDRITPAAEALVKKGYTQIKTQMAVGGLSDAQEIERIRLIREVVGPDIALLVDINQRWKAHEAIIIGRRIEDIGLA